MELHALGPQTFTGKLNSKLPHKNEDKRGQRHIICSSTNYRRSMCKLKRLKYAVLSSMIQEVKVSEEEILLYKYNYPISVVSTVIVEETATVYFQMYNFTSVGNL